MRVDFPSPPISRQTLQEWATHLETTIRDYPNSLTLIVALHIKALRSRAGDEDEDA